MWRVDKIELKTNTEIDHTKRFPTESFKAYRKFPIWETLDWQGSIRYYKGVQCCSEIN